MVRLLVTLLFLTSLFTHTNENLTREIAILHTNDIESVYEPIPATWRDDMELIGGI